MSATVLPLQNTERECQSQRERRSGKCTRRPERVVIEGGVGGIMRCGRNSGVADWVVVGREVWCVCRIEMCSFEAIDGDNFVAAMDLQREMFPSTVKDFVRDRRKGIAGGYGLHLGEGTREFVCLALGQHGMAG